MLVELRSGALRLVLRPELGASITGLWHGEVPVLRSVDDAAALASERDAASYALVPYSNRIGYRRFRWHGRDHALASNYPEEHTLHGVGWQRPWQVLESGASSVELGCEHAPDQDWPYAFSARQRIALEGDTLKMALSITNTGDAPQPVGLGWHPYFPKRPHSRLHIDLSARWECDPATLLPTRRVAQPGLDSEVRHLDYDHCFEHPAPFLRIRDDKLSLKMSSSLKYLVIYARPEKDFYCVEPVSHVNNAVHMAEPMSHGLIDLAPGQTYEAWMALEIDAA